MNHTYESVGTLFPDGAIELYDYEYNSKLNNQEMSGMVWNALQNYNKAKTNEEQFAAVENAIRDYFPAEVIIRWSKDISTVIDELKKWNASGFLANHIDTSKIGVFGHSQGGAAAAQALLDDAKIKAGMNIDGMHWGSMIDTFMTKPFALLSSDWDADHPNWNKHSYHNGGTSDFYNAKILNSGHASFMDIALMIRIPIVNQAGSITPNKAYTLSSAFILQFFDKYLLNRSSDLLKLDKKYPEMDIQLVEKNDEH